MDYVKPEPTAVKVIAIFQLVFGVISLVCGLIQMAGGAGALAQGGRGGQQDQAEAERMLEDQIPNFKAAQYAEMAVSLLLSVLMVVSGAGLLNRQPWGRTVAITYAGLSIAFHIVDFLYGMLVVLPAMDAVFDKMAAKQGAAGAAGIMKGAGAAAMFGASAVIIYPIIVLVIMLRPGVKAALAGGGEPSDGPRDYDDRDRGPFGDVPPDDRYRQPPDDRLTP